MATIDRLYRSILLAVRFFSKGWGPTHAYESLARFNPVLMDPVSCLEELEPHRHPVELQLSDHSSWGKTYDGSFLSPTATLFQEDFLPPQAKLARFQLLLPESWRTAHRPVYIHLAGTGDHGFSRRHRFTALPLLKKEGFGALMLENPFYGSRKPPGQTRSQLLHVSDLLVMGLSLMLESVVLKKWLEEEVGLGPVGVTGASMGGHNASLAASIWPESVPVVPFLSWSTASSAFTQGMLSGAVCWDVLEEELSHARSSSDKIRLKMFDLAMEQREVLLRDSSSTRASKVERGAEETVDVLMAAALHRENSCAPHTTTTTTTTTTTMERLQPEVSPSYHSLISTKRTRESSSIHHETVTTLAAVLDLATHLHNYPLPSNPALAKFVVAKDDLYIPRQHITSMPDTWPGCEVQYVSGGHVSATVMQQYPYQCALTTKMQEKILTKEDQ